MRCGLCSFEGLPKFFYDEKRDWTYWHCDRCDLIFRDPQSYLSQLQEKARYQTHNNTIESEGYVRFLTPAVEAVKKHVSGDDLLGLDYGCGPGPTLSELLRRSGYSCDDYDPIFFPELKSEKYDFITCTEVVEHFYRPGREFAKMVKLLRPGGLLVVMTDHHGSRDFASWPYRTDPTHVCFYSAKTWEWMARALGWKWLEVHDRISVFQMPDS